MLYALPLMLVKPRRLYALIATAAYLLLMIPAQAQVPTITSFSPAAGASGATVVITGTNFNTTAANNAVFFNGVRGTVTAATATQLTVTVPAAARSGFIDVVNLGSFRQVK
nr:IPT/TIG domain-containing protein [Chitinophagaceae bacterium]